MSSIYNFSKEFATIGKEAFIETHSKAKLTGKMLAHYLTEDKCAFQDRSISLIGYSLGCQVIKSTLNRLYKLGRHDLIHNVYWLAAAASIEKPIQQHERFSKVISGRFANIYTKDDGALKLFTYVMKK